MQTSFESLVKVLLPSQLLDYFELTLVDQIDDAFHLHLQEINKPPEAWSSQPIQSKGFFEPITVQDFPIRGHRVFLHIKRRRWLVLDTNQVIFRDWNLVANGTRFTQEFADFLKEISRY